MIQMQRESSILSKGKCMSVDLNKMPKLGFGLMRLPEKDGVIDHEHVCKMVDR